jgi:hypothetical protein
MPSSKNIFAAGPFMVFPPIIGETATTTFSGFFPVNLVILKLDQYSPMDSMDIRPPDQHFQSH